MVAVPSLFVVLRSKMEVIAAVTVALFWKLTRAAVSVAVPRLFRISGVPVAAELSTLKVVWPREAVEEAWKTPATCKGPATVEEAEEINPARLAKDPTVKVEEAESGPPTVRLLAILEEAEETKPPVRVARLVTDKVSPKVATPPIFKVEEERNTPETWRLEVTVEEPTEINPPSSLANPATVKVDEACNDPAI